jgi:hypothetical protein
VKGRYGRKSGRLTIGCNHSRDWLALVSSVANWTWARAIYLPLFLVQGVGETILD